MYIWRGIFSVKLEIISTLQALKTALQPYRHQLVPVGLVPTMGALHKGHLSLIDLAKQQTGLVVCSIFVNPTQFTDPKDLEKYPRPLEHDIRMLTEAGCDIVFMPSVKEMYPAFPEAENWHIDLGPAEFVLEGAFRKGHYQGVTQIVKKLFDAVMPDVAFFGQKDFQQVLMIQNMVQSLQIPVKLVSCPIIREDDGLAMSSRNIHLSAADRQHALVLSRALKQVKAHFEQYSFEELQARAEALIRATPGVELDYFIIADQDTLLPLRERKAGKAIALVAAKVGETRLIDNMLLN